MVRRKLPKTADEQHPLTEEVNHQQEDPTAPYAMLPNVSTRRSRRKQNGNLISTTAKFGTGMYVRLLQSNPLLTKTLTAGFVAMIGDLLAQLFEHRMSSNGALFVLDAPRSLGMAFEYTFLSAPLMHYAYNYLEYIIPIHDTDKTNEEEALLGGSTDLDKTRMRMQSLKRWAAATSHVLTDIFVLGPFYVLFIMFGTSLFEGRISSLQADLLVNYIPTVKAAVATSLGFMPMQVAAFGVLPTQFRLLYINFQDIIWSAVVSFTAHKARYNSELPLMIFKSVNK